MGSTPLTARCPKCKKHREWNMDRDSYDNLSDKNLVPTGRTRKGISAGGRHNTTFAEYKHDGPGPVTAPCRGDYCGHVFWTTHPWLVKRVDKQATNRHHVGGC